MTEIYPPTFPIPPEEFIKRVVNQGGKFNTSMFKRPEYSTKNKTDRVKITGEELPNPEERNYKEFRYTIKDHTKYDHMSGCSLFITLPELKFKEGYVGHWNPNVLINMIMQYGFYSDTIETSFHEGIQESLLLHRAIKNNPQFEHKIGNRPSLILPENSIRSEEISLDVPWPWSRAYYTGHCDFLSFPLFMIGASNLLFTRFILNLDVSKLVTTYKLSNIRPDNHSTYPYNSIYSDTEDETIYLNRVDYNEAIFLPDGHPVKINNPVLYIDFHTETPLVKAMTGIEGDKDCEGKSTKEYYVIFETYSRKYTNPIKDVTSGEKLISQSLTVPNFIDVVYGVQNNTLSHKIGTPIFRSSINYTYPERILQDGYTICGGQSGDSIVNEAALTSENSANARFYPGYMTEVEFSSRAEPTFNTQSGFSIIRNDISTYDVSYKARSSTSIVSETVEIKTNPSLEDKFSLCVFFRTIKLCKFTRSWSDQNGRNGKSTVYDFVPIDQADLERIHAQKKVTM